MCAPWACRRAEPSDIDPPNEEFSVKRAIEFATDSGETVLIEVDDRGAPEVPVRGSRGGEIAGKAARTFEQALSSIKPAAEAVVSAVTALSEQPDEIQVTFGLKLTATVAMIASTGAEGNFAVTLTWKRAGR
jgi:hypothetical protein